MRCRISHVARLLALLAPVGCYSSPVVDRQMSPLDPSPVLGKPGSFVGSQTASVLPPPQAIDRVASARGTAPVSDSPESRNGLAGSLAGATNLLPPDLLKQKPDGTPRPGPSVTLERSDVAADEPGSRWISTDIRPDALEDALLPSITSTPAQKPSLPAKAGPLPLPDSLLPPGGSASDTRRDGTPGAKLPPLPVRKPAPDDGAVHLGGIVIPIPPDALAPPRVRPAAGVMQPLTAEPPIRTADTPTTLPPITGGTSDAAPPVLAPPAKLPALPTPPPPPAPPGLPGIPPVLVDPSPGPIDVGGTPLPFESLSQLIDGGAAASGGGCASCGGSGCASCGGGQCAAGHKPCEPYPARTCVGRVIGLVYENICCPNPCYQPHWEAITAAAFFTDAPRPVTQTRFRWDYGSDLKFPDRGEMFWARADGSGRGPKPISPHVAVPSVSYHELYLDQEIASGPASVTISTPYRSVNPYPDAPSSAGFGDLQITAKSLLFDSELFLFAFQMRTYIPTGIASKGLGTGHTSLEPGLIAGIRVGPNTYAAAQVEEWIPLGGDSTYSGAALKYNFSFNHILWRPVKDVQLIGTWEMTGLSFQDGAYTDPVLGSGVRLSGQTSLNMGAGLRLGFCDKFDVGAGWAHEIAGHFLPLEMLRVECRYRF